jgi:hypothetical protein
LARFRLFLLGLLLTSPLTARAATPATLSLLDGETVVPAGSYVAWRVPGNENPTQTGMVVGELRSKAGARDRFAVAVLSEYDFVSWQKGYRAYPVYVARQVAQVELRTRLPRADVYYVVVSNPLPATHPSTIRGTIRLMWTPATHAVASAAPASSAATRRDLVSFGLVVLLAGALALWSIHEGRDARTLGAEKRAA